MLKIRSQPSSPSISHRKLNFAKKAILKDAATQIDLENSGDCCPNMTDTATLTMESVRIGILPTSVGILPTQPCSIVPFRKTRSDSNVVMENKIRLENVNVIDDSMAACCSTRTTDDKSVIDN